jgi:hypothetical protein
VRPEVVAFRELDTLVRNLSDQLAGYRRRAMAAEARTRELEGLLVAAHAAERDSRALLTASEQALGEAMRTKVRAEADAAAAREALAVQLAAVVVPTPPTFSDDGRELSADEVALRRENTELRTLLDAARERTAQLLERTRFLRQQIGAGAEK